VKGGTRGDWVRIQDEQERLEMHTRVLAVVRLSGGREARDRDTGRMSLAISTSRFCLSVSEKGGGSREEEGSSYAGNKVRRQHQHFLVVAVRRCLHHTSMLWLINVSTAVGFGGQQHFTLVKACWQQSLLNVPGPTIETSSSSYFQQVG
jgi:hypothetical protein